MARHSTNYKQTNSLSHPRADHIHMTRNTWRWVSQPLVLSQCQTAVDCTKFQSCHNSMAKAVKQTDDSQRGNLLWSRVVIRGVSIIGGDKFALICRRLLTDVFDAISKIVLWLRSYQLEAYHSLGSQAEDYASVRARTHGSSRVMIV